jgi:hypothetical protein
MTPTILKSSLVVVLAVALSVGSQRVIADKINQNVSEHGIGVVHTGSGSINIGITLEQYKRDLKEREEEVTERLKKAHSSEQKLLLDKVAEIKANRANLQSSFEEHIKDLKERITQLETLRGEVPDNVLEQAQNALATGDTRQAEKLFLQIENQADKHIKASAEAKYQRCRIEEDTIHFTTAFSLLYTCSTVSA